MGANIYFLIEAVFSFFLGLLMFLDYRKYRESIFKFLSLVFFVIVAKSVVYLSMHYFDIYYSLKETIPGSGAFIPRPFEALNSLYHLRSFIWQGVETLFILALSFTFIFRRRSVEGKSSGGLKVALWAQLVAIIAIMAFVMVTSFNSHSAMKMKVELRHPTDNSRIISKKIVIEHQEVTLEPGEKSVYKKTIENGKEYVFQTIRTYKSSPVIELLKWPVGSILFVIWKILLLIFTITSLSSIYGYIASLLAYISKNKTLIFTYVIMAMVFYLFSFVNYSVTPFWYVLDVIAVILLSVFGYKVHLQYINNIEDMVDNLARERDIIISLMRDISTIVGSGNFDMDSVIKQIVDSSVKGSGARAGTVFLKDPLTNRLSVQYVTGLYPPSKIMKSMTTMTVTESMIQEKLKAEKISLGEGLIGEVAESGEAIYIPDVSKDERYVQTIKEHMKVTSFIAVPLKGADDVFGVLSVVDDSHSFLESDLSLIETLGEQAAITIKQIQMYQEILEKKQAEKELGVAGEIQSSLVPHTFPETNKYEMYGFSIPAKGVGGDYYDYIDFGKNKLAVTMFDVSGKGVPAALIMVMIRSILRTIASLDKDTKDVLTKLNDTISEEIVEDRYATGFYLLFDAERGIMSYTNAGHGPLILFRAKQDTFEFLDTDGMPVGIMSGVEYGQDYTTLESGDIAILYTDGITEAMNETHEEFGMERLYAVIRQMKRETARGVANKVLEEVNRFVGTAPQHDDETLLVLKAR